MPDWGKQIDGGWFDPDKHIYRDERGTVVPSVTQIFSLLGYADFSSIDAETLEWKRTFGTIVHKAVELLVQNDLDWDSCDERIIPSVVGIEQRLKEMQYRSEAVEEAKIFNLFGMKYGGTCDHRGMCNHHNQERHCIIDIKTSVKEEVYWKWQVAAYTVGLPKNDKPWLGLVLQVDKEGKVTPHYIDTYSAMKEFQILLAACIIGINSGDYKIGKS